MSCYGARRVRPGGGVAYIREGTGVVYRGSIKATKRCNVVIHHKVLNRSYRGHAANVVIHHKVLNRSYRGHAAFVALAARIWPLRVDTRARIP